MWTVPLVGGNKVCCARYCPDLTMWEKMELKMCCASYWPFAFWPLQYFARSLILLFKVSLFVHSKTGLRMDISWLKHALIITYSPPQKSELMFISRECKDESVQSSKTLEYLWADDHSDSATDSYRYYQRPYNFHFCLTLTIVTRGLAWMPLTSIVSCLHGTD